jgi:SNF2 family DNA or RNA helicase
VVWAKELFSHFPHRKYAIAWGNHETRVRAIKSNSDFVIINHDGIKSVEAELIAEQFDIIVIDEMTAFKNAQSERSKCMQRISKKSKAIWGLSGAPTPNGPTEAWGQSKIVTPDNPYLPKYFTKFRAMVETEIAPYVYVSKPEAKDIVYKILQPAIRFERNDCLDLPPCFEVDEELEMTPDQKIAYENIRKELLHEYADGNISAVNAAVKLSKLLQITAGAVKNDEGDICYFDITPKIDSIIETFDELGRTKLLVMSAFRASVERVCQLLQEKKIKCRYIHGGVNANERANIVNDFQDGDLQILVLQPQTMAHGVNLTASSTIVWSSYVSSGETYLQVNGRITRAGQTQKQFIKHQVASKAERHVLNILQRKGDMSKEVLKLFVDGDL